MNYTAASNKYGTVDHNGTTLALTQVAYIDNLGTDGGVRYYARAIDAAGQAYLVAWETTVAWDTAEAAYKADPENAMPNEDESMACNWTVPAEITALS